MKKKSTILNKTLTLKFLKDKIFWLMLLLGPFFIFSYQLFDSSKPLTWETQNINLFFQLVFLPSLMEEMIFRGILYEGLSANIRLKKKIFGISYVNIITSLLFALVHFFNHPLPWAISVFIPSLIFGKAKERYETILAPILIHLFYNLSYFTFLK